MGTAGWPHVRVTRDRRQSRTGGTLQPGEIKELTTECVLLMEFGSEGGRCWDN